MKKLLILCVFPLFVHATELLPWYGRDLEPHFRAEYLFQNYASNNDHFLNLGLEGTYDEWQAEVETVLADTHEHNFGFDCFRLTGRYQWLSDVIGDSLTLTTGITLTAATRQGLDDVSSFHHGLYEGEFHLSAGKEFANFEYWISRVWCVAGIGMAEQGSPWIRGDLAWEKNWCEMRQLRIFANTLWGTGDNSLNVDSFSGYGSINHASVDVGARYSIQTEYWGELALQYARRVYSRNFPGQTNRFTVSFMYPFWF